MTDQSVNITNLPDSGSHERVAFDLWQFLKSQLPERSGEADISQQLALYVRCLRATIGNAA